MKFYYSTILLTYLIECTHAFVPGYTGFRNPSLWSVRSMVKDAPSIVGSDVSIPYDSAARLAYDEWRAQFNKGDFDELRYEIFKANYEIITIANVSAKKKARDEGTNSLTLMSLNEYGDLTESEYNEALAAGSKMISTGDVLTKAVENAELQSEASSALGEAADALAEEEKILAEKLGLNSVEELEAALDSLEGIAPDGGELDSQNIARQARIRDSYLKWCKEFNKKPDESRYPTFSNNFLLMEQYAKETNKEMNLNEYADCTKEEYEAMQKNRTIKQAKIDEKAETAEEAKLKQEAEQEAKRKADEEEEKQAAKLREMRAKELAERSKLESERRKQIDEEKAARLKKQEAEAAKQQAEKEVAIIAAAKADAERQAKLAAQRAKIEAEAATLIRKQAKDWDEKQRRLTTGGKVLPKAVKKPSLFNIFQSEPSIAPTPKPSTVPKKAPPAPKTQTPITGFSFFTAPAPAPAPKKVTSILQPPKPTPSIAVKKPESTFSFFAPALKKDNQSSKVQAKIATPPVVAKDEKSSNFFSFLAPPKQDPVQSATKVTQKKETIVPNKLGSISLFGIGDFTPKPGPAKVAPLPVRSGTISLKKAPAPSPSISIPNRPGTISIKKTQAPKPSPAFSFFSSSTPAPKASQPTSTPAPKNMQPASKPSPTFSLFSLSSPTSPTPSPKVKESLSKPSTAFSFFGSPNASKSANKVVTPKQQVKSSPSISLSLLSTVKAPPKDVPILSQWKQNPDGSVTGKVSNSPNFRTGTQITTSPVPKGAKAGTVVKTGSGSQYFLR